MSLTKKKMIESLTKIQRSLCAYDAFPVEMENAKNRAPSQCDCKYGATQVGSKHEIGNGCPEMRDVIDLVGLLTKKEFARLLKRQAKLNHKLAKATTKAWKKKQKEQKRAQRILSQVGTPRQ